MRIGIITFHNGSNYGAALQAFALQQVYKKDGNECYIINYKNRFIMQGLDTVRWGLSLHNVYYSLIDILNYRDNRKKIANFYAFFEKYYCLTPLLDRDELKNEQLNFDMFVSGSDQIWNPLLSGTVDDIYFGKICNITDKISYASSFGSYKFDNAEWNKKIENLLKDYRQISVRENANLIKKELGLTVQEVCDPTLLLSKDEWKSALNIKESNEKYILVYALCDFKHVMEIACKIAEQKNLKIKFIGKLLKKYKYTYYCTDIGPKEFVELFYNATFVVTNSFHGTAFSVNFKKQFYSVIHPSSPERANSFLKRINLQSRLLNSCLDMKEDITASEYQRAHGMLEKIKAYSRKSLY